MDFSRFWNVAFEEFERLPLWQFLSRVRPLRYVENTAFGNRAEVERKQREKGIEPESDRARRESVKTTEKAKAELTDVMARRAAAWKREQEQLTEGD